MATSAADVAKRMLELLEDSDTGPTMPPKSKELDQQDAVNMIRKEFGEEFLYENANGNVAIDNRVLAEFRKLTKDTVVWEKSGYWRKRTPRDPVGKRQSD
jgi:hypothetical protein